MAANKEQRQIWRNAEDVKQLLKKIEDHEKRIKALEDKIGTNNL